MESPPKIKKLDETVVNRIAAGEIIQKPANALKELIENSLDAKSTDIQITVKDGGLKLLQIQDNGTGIRKDDLDIVCERFTTSKLEKFEDLHSISTYGFRGEALASISHVAQLTITTKTAQGKVAYKASYTDGKLKSAPKPIAGNQGTLITIENLFYNVVTRRKALENTSEQFSHIAEVVTRYAIHNAGVGFTLKKHGVHTPIVRTSHKSSKIDNIKSLYGNEISRELIDLKIEDNDYKFKLQTLYTNPNYSNKKMTFLLFINHRLVENTQMKKMLEDVYSIYLPRKTHPWIYISLEISPGNVDVNIHPTKSEVRFLYEDKIIDKIKGALDDKLSANSSSRTFYIQARLPEVNITKDVLAEVLTEYDEEKNKDKDKEKKIYAKDMIRVDHKEQKLDKFNFTVSATSDTNTSNNITNEFENDNNLPGTSSDKEFADELTSELQIEESSEKTGNDDLAVKIVEADGDLQPNQSVNTTNFNSESMITSTQTEKNVDVDENQIGEIIISDLAAEFFTTDESSTELPDESVTMSKTAERAIKSVFRMFGSQTDAQVNSEQKSKENYQKNTESLNVNKIKTGINSENLNTNAQDSHKSKSLEFKSSSTNNFRRDVDITSILQLRKSIEDTYHEGLKKLLSELKFVGCVDEELSLIQSDVNLYLCNTRKLAEELFYEIMLYDFQNYGVLRFSEPLSLVELSIIALNMEEAGWSEQEKPKLDMAHDIRNLFVDKADMLKEYFSIQITKNGHIKSLPILLENYYPSEADLPFYILRMATEVNWADEKSCFDGICRETAKFFSHINPNSEVYDWKHLTEHILYATIKESLLPPKHFAHDSTVLQIASLPDLYKVFERC